LHVREPYGLCRLWLGGRAYGDGQTLQEAADDLVTRLLRQARALRAGTMAVPAELGAPDHRWFEFLWEVAEIADRGGDVRAYVLR
jgi:hypothetical protein